MHYTLSFPSITSTHSPYIPSKSPRYKLFSFSSLLHTPYLPLYISKDLDNFRSFIDLGQTMGLSQVILPSELNAASSMIPIPGGFPFGTSLQSSVYVRPHVTLHIKAYLRIYSYSGIENHVYTHIHTQVVEHGYFSFGSLLIQSSPDIFPSSASFLVAPFWAAHDTRGSGQVSYEVHDTSSEVMSRISAYVRQEMNTEFFGVWMLLTYWNGVPAFPHTDNSGVVSCQ